MVGCTPPWGGGGEVVGVHPGAVPPTGVDRWELEARGVEGPRGDKGAGRVGHRGGDGGVDGAGGQQLRGRRVMADYTDLRQQVAEGRPHRGRGPLLLLLLLPSLILLPVLVVLRGPQQMTLLPLIRGLHTLIVSSASVSSTPPLLPPSPLLRGRPMLDTDWISLRSGS